MNTKKYKIRTEFIEKKNLKKSGVWEIALDLGYSSVKAMSPNSISTFPSFAVRTAEEIQFACKTPKEAIMYLDLDTNETWVVGEYAQNSISNTDTSVSEAIIYSRDRFSDPMFKVIARTGIGVSIMENLYGSFDNKHERIVIQTGLPERYLSDSESLVDVLSGHHNFALKVGSKDWTFFSIDIDNEDVYVISQPKGSLFSVCVDNNGKPIPQNIALLSSNVIVFDAGFGTLDLFIINSGEVLRGETFADLGMKRVLQETSKLINEEFRVNIPVPAMQSYLETGLVRKAERKASFEVKEYPFDTLLAKASNYVCEQAIDRMIASIGWDNFTQHYKYMIVTGGTGAAWYHNIEEKFKNFSGFKVLRANQNDTLPFIYSNVRGYYLYRHNKIVE